MVQRWSSPLGCVLHSCVAICAERRFLTHALLGGARVGEGHCRSWRENALRTSSSVPPGMCSVSSPLITSMVCWPSLRLVSSPFSAFALAAVSPYSRELRSPPWSPRVEHRQRHLRECCRGRRGGVTAGRVHDLKGDLAVAAAALVQYDGEGLCGRGRNALAVGNDDLVGFPAILHGRA